jgi:hypothetical protein
VTEAQKIIFTSLGHEAVKSETKNRCVIKIQATAHITHPTTIFAGIPLTAYPRPEPKIKRGPIQALAVPSQAPYP